MLRWWNDTKSMVVKSVVHMRSEWTRKVRVRGRKKVAGTQYIDRCWQHLKKNAPVKWKNRTGPTINARFWDRIYQWIYRHNMSKWDIASRCDFKNCLCKLFVVSWRNCWFEKWQNVRRFDTLMSKTHCCVNPYLYVKIWCGDNFPVRKLSQSTGYVLYIYICILCILVYECT